MQPSPKQHKFLTKSRYLDGWHCPKYLWTEFNSPHDIPGKDVVTLYLLEQGNRVCCIAQKTYPEGVKASRNYDEGSNEISELIKKRCVLFEGSISSGSLYARADILIPSINDTWDLVEVKSSTSVKDYHIKDVAFQKYCCDKFGLKINKCFLQYVNKEYIKNGNIDPVSFFSKEDVTDRVSEIMKDTISDIEQALEVIAADKCPNTTMGRKCKSNIYGDECPFREMCSAALPENNVFELYRGGQKSEELLDSGISAIKDIPENTKLTANQRIQWDCARNGSPYVDAKAIKGFVDSLKYPLYYFDFETINPCIPIFDETSPYEYMPFQYSLHIVDSAKSKIIHHSFISNGAEDPRKELLLSLKNRIGPEGSIVVYHKSFEESRLKELIAKFPKEATWLSNVISRLVDLEDPFKGFHYYHSKQKGSASLKKVLPVLTNKSYDGLNIDRGDQASIIYLNIIGNQLTDYEKTKALEDLEKYCSLDTEGMIEIVNVLEKY